MNSVSTAQLAIACEESGPADGKPVILPRGESAGVRPPASSERRACFSTGGYQRRVIPVAGHFRPREAPDALVQAIRALGG